MQQQMRPSQTALLLLWRKYVNFQMRTVPLTASVGPFPSQVLMLPAQKPAICQNQKPQASSHRAHASYSLYDEVRLKRTRPLTEGVMPKMGFERQTAYRHCAHPSRLDLASIEASLLHHLLHAASRLLHSDSQRTISCALDNVCDREPPSLSSASFYHRFCCIVSGPREPPQEPRPFLSHRPPLPSQSPHHFRIQWWPGRASVPFRSEIPLAVQWEVLARLFRVSCSVSNPCCEPWWGLRKSPRTCSGAGGLTLLASTSLAWTTPSALSPAALPSSSP
mmetsp:Transcript_3740/g.15163  ORF Transcript_3740/g.15163 Transcript_3740/m.15163 type:complete len:278 (+) Transcript_3740:723-1556(+)